MLFWCRDDPVDDVRHGAFIRIIRMTLSSDPSAHQNEHDCSWNVIRMYYFTSSWMAVQPNTHPDADAFGLNVERGFILKSSKLLSYPFLSNPLRDLLQMAMRGWGELMISHMPLPTDDSWNNQRWMRGLWCCFMAGSVCGSNGGFIYSAHALEKRLHNKILYLFLIAPAVSSCCEFTFVNSLWIIELKA